MADRKFSPSPVNLLLLSIVTPLVKCKSIDKHDRILLVVVFFFFVFEFFPQPRLSCVVKSWVETADHTWSRISLVLKKWLSSQLLVPRPDLESPSWLAELTSLSSSVVPCHFKRTGTSMLRQFALLLCKVHLLCQQLQDHTLLKWSAYTFVNSV